MTASNRFIISSQDFMLSVLCGILLTTGFPPVEWTFAPWISFVFLLWAIRNLDAAKAFSAGFTAGLAHFLTLLYWLVPTINIYGYLPIWLSVIIVMLLAVYLSLYMAVFSSLISRLRFQPASAVLMIPALWVCIEYLRGNLFTGFPWGLIGYSQHGFLKFIQIADLFGVYGISFLIVLSNSVIFFALLYATKRQWHEKPVNLPLVCSSAVFLAALIALAIMYGNMRIKAIDQMAAQSKSVAISVIQGNIDQDQKWDKKFCNATIDTYFRLSKQELDLHPDLIIWPETAAPFYFGYNGAFTEKVINGIRDAGKDFLTGAPTVDIFGKQEFYYNSAYLISPDGKILGRYDKVHLVPFGEYVPFKNFLPFLGKLVEQVGDFNTGQIGKTLKWEAIDLGVLICYEAIFPGLAAKLVENGSGILVSLTNDAWFGNTGAPYQHFFMAMFRAIETRRTLVRAANTGISGFIHPSGRVTVQTGIFKEAALTRRIPVIENYQTFYTRYGDVLVWLCFIAIMAFMMILLYKRKS